MEENFGQSGGKMRLGILSSNYIVNIIATLDFSHAQFLGREKVPYVFLF